MKFETLYTVAAVATWERLSHQSVWCNHEMCHRTSGSFDFYSGEMFTSATAAKINNKSITFQLFFLP